MSNAFQNVLNWVYENFKKDASKMLICTGVAGWSLSSIAQICAILFNKEIPNEQKGYLLPQEFLDALVNIGSFFLVTQVTKKTVAKLFSTGKFASKSVRSYLDKNKNIFADKIGKLDFDLDKVLKAHPDFPKDAYYASKNFGTTIATIGAGIFSSNVITPIVRNKMATKMQKKYLDAKSEKPANTLNVNQQVSTPNYYSSQGLKI